MNTAENGTQNTQDMVGTSWFLRMVKAHGLSTALMFVGLYVYDDKLSKAEARISAVENKLYECYEKRISAENSSPISESNYLSSQVFVVPKKQKYSIKQKRT